MHNKGLPIVVLMTIALAIMNFAYALESSNPEYVFVSELSPGEGLPEFYAATNQLTLHKEPSKSSPVVEQYKIKKGEKIAFDETRYCTVKPSIVKTVNSTYLHDVIKYGKLNYLSMKTYYDSGSGPESKFTLKSGEVIEYLQYRAESSCIFRWRGDVYAGSCSWEGSDNSADFKMSSLPINDLWVRVTEIKKPFGWFLVEKKLVTGSTLPYWHRQ